jgi:hypothetical protein
VANVCGEAEATRKFHGGTSVEVGQGKVEAAIMASQENFRPVIKKLRAQTNISLEKKKANREDLRAPTNASQTLRGPLQGFSIGR